MEERPSAKMSYSYEGVEYGLHMMGVQTVGFARAVSLIVPRIDKLRTGVKKSDLSADGGICVAWI